MPAPDLASLRTFRADLYGCVPRRADALELVAALLAAESVTSLPHLSLQAAHRRGLGSSTMPWPRVVSTLRLCARRWPSTPPPTANRSTPSTAASGPAATPRRVRSGGWITTHPATRPDNHRRWLVLPMVGPTQFRPRQWTAPLDVRRVHPQRMPTPSRSRRSRRSWRDTGIRGHAPVRLRRRLRLGAVDAGLGRDPVAILVRLRADRCFYADPPPAIPSPTGGRPRKHGAKFACKDPTTWSPPTAEQLTQDEQYGTVRVRAWTRLHPKQQAHPGRGTRKPRPIVRGTVVLVEVSRLPARPYRPKVLWLWWAGPGEPDLDLLWRAYVRRFDMEHTLRFCKQTWAGRRRGCGTRSKPIAGPGWS